MENVANQEKTLAVKDIDLKLDINDYTCINSWEKLVYNLERILNKNMKKDYIDKVTDKEEIKDSQDFENQINVIQYG